MHRSTALAALLTFCLLLLPSAAYAEATNVVLVMADDQGWGDMAYNGHPHVKTPHFDALAKEGLRFDRFYAAHPVCSPTRGSVMTGRTPNRYGCYSWGHPIRPQEITIAEALKTAGYRTGHFGKWHIGSVQAGSPVSPGNSGFDTWVSAFNFFDISPILSVKGRATKYTGDSSDVTAREATDFIRECAQKKEKFLAVVWFGSPHAPHQALADDRAPYANLPQPQQHFLGEITAMDRAVGALREELKKQGLSENTILWYCSDNGALPKVGSTGGRRGFKASIYDGGIAVPGLIEWPAMIKSPRTTDLPCVTSDIYPTVLEACGVKMENQPPLDGVSLMPLLKGEMKERPRAIGFWDSGLPGISTPSAAWMNDLYEAQQAGEKLNDPKRVMPDAGQIKSPSPLDKVPGHAAWIDGTWKLHRIVPKKSNEPRYELYNLANDPQESTNLFEKEPERAGKMTKDLEAWLESVVQSVNGKDYARNKSAQ